MEPIGSLSEVVQMLVSKIHKWNFPEGNSPMVTTFRMLSVLMLPLCAIAAGPLRAEVTVVEGLRQPFSIVFTSQGTIYGVEYEEGNRVFRLDNGKLSFLAGESSGAGHSKGDVAEGDGGPAAKGRFNGMHDLTMQNEQMLYIADTFDNRIRSIDLKTMRLETFAGAGGSGAYATGAAKVARFNNPFTVDLHPDGKRLLIADLGNRRVREVNLQTGMVRTVAGNGKRAIPEEGEIATKTSLVAPRAAIYGRDGSIFIVSREGNALRQVTPDGRIYTVVNTAGKRGYGGDDGPGGDAKLNGPKHLCLDPQGNVVIADDQNACIRLYRVKEKTIHLLAGMPGKPGNSVGTGPFDTQLNRPHGSRYDGQGRLWVCDSWNNRLLCFDAKK